MLRRVVIRSRNANLVSGASPLKAYMGSRVPRLNGHSIHVVRVGKLSGEDVVFYVDVSEEIARAIYDKALHLPELRLSNDVSYRSVSPPPPSPGQLPGCQFLAVQGRPTGRGVGIGVIDEAGVNDHSAFEGRLRRYEVRDGVLCDAPESDPDRNHGTMVAGVAAGRDCRSSAPDAQVVGVKVSRSALAIQIAMFRMLEAHPDVKVLCVPMGQTEDDRSTSPDEREWLHDSIRQIWREKGVVTCVPAGNDGDSVRIRSPGKAPYALTVGGFNSQLDCDPENDVVAEESTRGDPDTQGEIIKPDFLDYRGPRKTAVLVRRGNDMISEFDEGFVGTSCAVGYTAGLVAGWFEAVGDIVSKELRRILADESMYRQLPVERGGRCAARHVQGRGALVPEKVLEALRAEAIRTARGPSAAETKGGMLRPTSSSPREPR